jgi:RNA-binding protein YhbY
MNYRLEDISADDFEKLVNELCRIMLGIGVVDFSKGRDGGRDGRLTGTANEYPTKVNPWTGRFIIQAKHTEDYKASCSNNGFHGNKSSLVNGEIDKLNKLIGKGEIIDNYLIFTNRKEAESREAIIKHIKTQTNITNVDVIGNATISSWIFKNDALAKQFKLGLYALPLQLTEFDIKEVIISFGKNLKNIQKISTIDDEMLLSKDKEGQGGKNELNNLSATYYKNQIKSKTLKYFAQIDDFLQNDNDYADIYYNFAEELSNKIEVKRDNFNKFEEVFMYLYDLIFEANRIDLNKDRRLIWIFLHHLYFNCHIGRVA